MKMETHKGEIMEILPEIMPIDESGNQQYSLPASSALTATGCTRYLGQGQQIQQLNLTAMVMERLPTILEEMDYDALIEVYQRMYDIQAIRWKVSCAILAEAYFRVATSTPMGHKQQILKIIAGDFGVNVKRLYQKVTLWKTFWQDETIKDKVMPNKNGWVFEQFPNGEAYFREALTAPDPKIAITEAEKKYLSAINEGKTYTVKQFNIDLSLSYKNEEGRLQQISRKITDLADTTDNLITEEDKSFPHVREFSNKLKQIADGLSDAHTQEPLEVKENLFQKGLERLSHLLEESIVQVQSLISIGLEEIEPMEDSIISLWKKVLSLKEIQEGGEKR